MELWNHRGAESGVEAYIVLGIRAGACPRAMRKRRSACNRSPLCQPAPACEVDGVCPPGGGGRESFLGK